MGVRIEVGLGPLRWSHRVRIPRAHRGTLNLLGGLIYLAVLAGLWSGYALALIVHWRFAIVVFLAIGLVLGSGLWWLGRRVREGSRGAYEQRRASLAGRR